MFKTDRELRKDASPSKYRYLVGLRNSIGKDMLGTIDKQRKDFIGDAVKEIVNAKNLVNICTYRIKLHQEMGGTTAMLRRTLMKFFFENGIKALDFEGRLISHKTISIRSGWKMAKVDGVHFAFRNEDEDALRKGVITIYVPIWQREKAKRILLDYLSENRPQGHVESYDNGRNSRTRGLDLNLATQTQFVRDDIYEYIDRHFKRMIFERDWYTENRKRHKETFLLFGLPGTGKTSLYMHFASKYIMNVKICTPRSFVENFTDIAAQAEEDDRKPLLVLIEDIDACEELVRPEHRTVNVSVNTGEKDEFTYSTFINRLDGGEPPTNMIICMSTNRKDVLIESVTRRGRVDHSLEMIPLNMPEIAEHVKGEHQDYIASLPPSTFSISNIIELRYCETIKEIDAFAKWVAEEKQAI